MSTSKGRKIVLGSNGLGSYQDTIHQKSAEQAMLIKQDEMIVQMNAQKDIVVLTSAAGAGGSATEAMTVTGLLVADTIMSVCQSVKGANSLPLLGYNTQAANALTAVWSANPGANAIIVVTVARARTAVLKADLK